MWKQRVVLDLNGIDEVMNSALVLEKCASLGYQQSKNRIDDSIENNEDLRGAIRFFKRNLVLGEISA
jgi:hypothetical protein